VVHSLSLVDPLPPCAHACQRLAEYWDFSIDELARYDVPAMVRAVLAATLRPRLAYVGFSQGSAQMFAALSADPALQTRVALFCALSPAARAKGLSKSVSGAARLLACLHCGVLAGLGWHAEAPSDSEGCWRSNTAHYALHNAARLWMQIGARTDAPPPPPFVS
jgi:pimeloyl-ACP methyl ester carboxylesterase